MNRRFATLIVLTIFGGALIDVCGGAWNQVAVDLLACTVCGILILQSDVQTRRELIACVLISTACELFLTMVWGLYTYRLDNVPVFVPPCHALFYALGGWIALRVPKNAPPIIAVLAAIAAAGLAAWHVDVFSLALTICFLASLRYGPKPRLYATMFVMSLALELWGTWVGTWHWQPIVPGFGWPTLNPPFAAGAFYCVLDWWVGLAAKPRQVAPVLIRSQAMDSQAP